MIIILLHSANWHFSIHTTKFEFGCLLSEIITYIFSYNLHLNIIHSGHLNMLSVNLLCPFHSVMTVKMLQAGKTVCKAPSPWSSLSESYFLFICQTSFMAESTQLYFKIRSFYLGFLFAFFSLSFPSFLFFKTMPRFPFFKLSLIIISLFPYKIKV